MAAVGRIGRALRRVSGSGAGTVADKAAPANKAAAAKKTAPAKKTALAKKAAPAKKAPAKKAAANKDPAKKVPARRAAAARPAPAKKATANQVPAKKAPATKAPATRASAKKVPATKPAPARAAASGTKTVRGAKAPAPKAAPVTAPARAAAANAITVPRGSEWTRAELATVRKELVAELEQMRAAYDRSMTELNDLQQAGTDHAGDDQADAGSKTFEREQEQSIAANRLDLLTQIQRAVERIDAGTYGFCESCGRPIPKARLKAFPAATLDVNCKQREERR